MNIRRSWSRHGEEVKESIANTIEFIFVLGGILSPLWILWIQGLTW